MSPHVFDPRLTPLLDAYQEACCALGRARQGYAVPDPLKPLDHKRDMLAWAAAYTACRKARVELEAAIAQPFADKVCRCGLGVAECRDTVCP